MTGQGCTKSTQSETKVKNTSNIYEVYTFPYMSATGVLKMTVSAIDNTGVILTSKVFASVPIEVNMVTEYKGSFFTDSVSSVVGSSINFTIDSTWKGVNTYEF